MPVFGISSERSSTAVTTFFFGLQNDVRKVLRRFLIDIATSEGSAESSSVSMAFRRVSLLYQDRLEGFLASYIALSKSTARNGHKKMSTCQSISAKEVRASQRGWTYDSGNNQRKKP